MPQIKAIHYQTNTPVEVEIIAGLIAEVRESASVTSTRCIAPGLVDLQINGFKGIDFNDGELTLAEIREVTESLWQEGVTTYFPTLITNNNAAIISQIKGIVNARNADRLIHNSIGGIHLEGPFLSKEDGPRGAHPLPYIKAPDWDLFCHFQDAAAGLIKIITLSPEWPQAARFIEKCVASGVLVSIGHTAASSQQIREAIGAGATMSTHLGNATHLTLPRHDNYVFEQLANENLWSTLIADGNHLPEAVLKVYLRAKSEKSALVSDATKFAGLPPGLYESHIGGSIELNASGRLFMRDNPAMLAGSAQSLLQCVQHLVNSGITSLKNALDLASLKPAEILNAAYPYGIKAGANADLILFEETDNALKIVNTIKSGEVVYSAATS